MTTHAKAFGRALSRIRREQGFPGAFQFFKSVGGSKSLGLAFVSYWDMERGKKLPKSWRLKAIIAALGIEQGSPKAQELVRAYFKALSGSDELLQNLSSPAPAGADLSGRGLEEAATHQALSQLNVNLTLAQWKLCTRNTVTDACHNFLTETEGWVTVQELAKAIGFKQITVSKALKALAAGGLASLDGNKAHGKFAGKVIQPPPRTPATAQVRAALRRNCDECLANSKRVSLKRMNVRMTKANLDLYRQHLEKAVNLAAVYGNATENREDSAIYHIAAGIFQIYPKELTEQ